jgi:hypothetical protein
LIRYWEREIRAFEKGIARAQKRLKAARKREADASSRTTQILLRELRDECENVAALIRRLDKRGLSEAERDEVLGELSAAVLHLHTHTADLDEFLCEAD